MAMTWRQWRKSIAYALLLGAISAIGSLILNSRAFQIFRVEHLFSQDLELNDLYYRLESWQDKPRVHEVVVLNTASLGKSGRPAEFRSECADLIQLISRMEPSAIGVDLLFRHAKASDSPSFVLATRRLRQVVEQTPRVVMATMAESNQEELFQNQERGVVTFPERGRVSIRSYQKNFATEEGIQHSFGAALIEHHRKGAVQSQSVPHVFPIRYAKAENLVTPIHLGNQTQFAGKRTPGVPVIEARDILQKPDSFAGWIRGAMVVIGHSSDSHFDIEDKHRVPCDTVLVNRLPTLSGPIIHAIATDNMLTFSRRGWQYVPVWFRLFAGFAMLVSLIHLLLHTRFGKWANFVVLALATLPLIYLGFLLMSWGYYWPMNSTLLPFVFIEEIMEVIVPLIQKLVAVLHRKFRWLVVVVFMMVFPRDSHGQSIEVWMLQGKAECRGLTYSPDQYDSFVVHPGDSVSFEKKSQAFILDVETERSAVCTETGILEWNSLQRLLLNDEPSLGAEMIRLFLVENIANESKEVNVGAAYRSGGARAISPLSGSTVVKDTVWIGFGPESTPPAQLNITIRDSEGKEVMTWSNEGENGFWWLVPSVGEWVVELMAGGVLLSKGEFRTEGPEFHGRSERLRRAAILQCADCPPGLREAFRSKRNW